ncbi:glutamate 5-kinase [Methanococcoides methylutens]|uniref:Glutamate 5-kinase n=1 Tax=Methanococcoides methylutens MM1 TaxID=1434104 RepID=A0A0E3WZC1_METMT|nr:glutamate 5-kinase [Methanococcoides methylutens]AKB84610.1 Glutamate 5-kinase [Methanococcoides methylutens MM1]
MINRKEILDDAKKIVIKLGTTSISNEDGSLNTEFMEKVAAQVSELHNAGKQVILVSSGSIGIGIEILNLNCRPKEIPVRQAAAAVGQGFLMQHWMEAFRKYELNVAQILLTYDSFTNRLTYLNLRNSISTLLSYGVIPIINENDPICVHEIEATLGDNDKLSAMVASKTEADVLMLLTDIDGLYNKNPKRHDDALLLNTVEEITPTIESYGGSPTSMKGVGGMRTKIAAAKICNMAGCYMVIANSNVDNVISRVLSGENIGTLFLANQFVHKNRIRWIILGKASGIIKVDSGAKKAISNSMSLLPSGVLEVEGDFDRGDIVKLECNGEVFGKGITDYTSEELKAIKGKHTDMIAEILGYKNYDHVIKKENIGLLK